MDLTLLRAPDPAIRERLFAAIDGYNDATTGRTEPVRHLTITLRDDRGVEGSLAQRLKLGGAPQVVLADGQGVIREVRGESDLKKKLQAFGL